MEDKTKTEPKDVPTKKPKWLKVLEKQSWQAELVVSGLAIFGSLQIPAAINNLVDMALYYAPAKLLTILNFFFVYLFAAGTILIINFILHFVLRALWIGMLGLVSVYPNGINSNFETWSDDYNQKLKKEFPDINKFNQQLDNLCSSIFSISGFSLMIFLSISIMIIIYGIIAYLINLLVPNWNYTTIFLILFSIILIPGMFQSFLHLKSLQKKAWVKKIHFPLYKIYSKATFHIFYRPANYISLTFVTNSGFMKSSIIGFLYFVIMGTIAAGMLAASNVFLFEDNAFSRHQNNILQWQSSQYENTLPIGDKILGPTIQSDQITDKEIKLFVPRFAREQITVDSICSTKWEYDDKISSDENDKLNWKNRINCHNRYYLIYMNDSLLRDLKFYSIKHPNQGENGYLTHIPTSSCQKGDNILKVVIGYKIPETGIKKMYQIPFRFIPPND